MLRQYILPFEFEDMYHGLAECKGLLKLAEDFLHFEFQTKDKIINLIKSDVKNVKIDYLQIGNIEFQKKMFSSQIIIHLNSMEVLSYFPNSPSELILKIKKANRELAKQMINKINVKIGEKKLEKLENM